MLLQLSILTQISVSQFSPKGFNFSALDKQVKSIFIFPIAKQAFWVINFDTSSDEIISSGK
jgi:hypothetical protein